VSAHPIDNDDTTEALADWDERFREWDRTRWAPLQSLCYACAAKKHPLLARSYKKLFDEAEERRKRERLGPIGMTGATCCTDCGGRRSDWL
jgi:hypothetical protein